jgi:hypothetical protein
VAEDEEPDPVDLAILDVLQGRDGRLTIVRLEDGRRLRTFNIAWGYDRGDRFSHVTTNISPDVEGEAIDFFFTNEVTALLDEDQTTLYPPPELRYEDPGLPDRAEALAAFGGDDSFLISTMIVGLALYDPDGEWIEEQCWHLAGHSDPAVRGTAGLCLGHVARRFRKVRPRSWALVRELCDDPAIDDRPCDALDDMRHFAGPEPEV